MAPPYCFVIMPYGKNQDANGIEIDYDDVYHFIIKEVVEDRLRDLALGCLRCDDIQSPGWVHRDMLTHIAQADVAIVDLSTLNANVFYELGVRHTLRRGVTVLIQKKGTPRIFNLSGFRVIDYDIDLGSANRAKEAMAQAIRNGLKRQENDSLVYEVFPQLDVVFP